MSQQPRPKFTLVGKPKLQIHAADYSETARALACVLAREVENLFSYNGEPHLVVRNNDKPKVRPLSRTRIIIEAHKHVAPWRFDKQGNPYETTLPDDVAGLTLDILADEMSLRPLLGFTTGPLLHDDGTIISEGYDDKLQVLACNVPALDIPDQVDATMARAALQQLRFWFRTFPFADRDTVKETFQIDGKDVAIDVVDLSKPPAKDESAYLNGLLTGVARASLYLAPGVATTSAHVSGAGAGKTYLMKSIGLIAFGKAPKAKGIGTGEEAEKGIVAGLISPGRYILLDNLNSRTLTSDNLCAALTERPAEMRILGVSEMRDANPTAFIGFTGNALTIGLDLIRRIINFELDARCEHAERREFAGDFLSETAMHRPELLNAALTILRYGRQHDATLARGEALGGFPQWCRWVRDPLLALGCKDPVARIPEAKQADPARINALEIFSIWWQYHQNNEITTKDLHAHVKTTILSQVDTKKRNRQALAERVSQLKKTVVGDFRLEGKGINPIIYKLTRPGEPEPPPRQSDIFDQANAVAPPPGPQPSPPSDDPWDDGCSDPVEPEDEQQPDTLPPSPPEPPPARDPFARQPPMKDGVLRFAMDRKPRSAGQRTLETLGPAPFGAICLQCERADGEIMRISAGPDDTYHLHATCAEKWFAGVKVRGAFDPSDERPTKKWDPPPAGSAAWVEQQVEAHRVRANREAPPSDPNECAAWVLDKLKALPDEPPAGYQNAHRWRLARAAMVKFAEGGPNTGNLLAQALRLGWTLPEMFATSAFPEVGVRAFDQCGAMLPNVFGAIVTHVDKDALHFSGGLVVRKRPVALATCLLWER
jgi:hypothetical protein